MTKKEINREIAEKHMGWHEVSYAPMMSPMMHAHWWADITGYKWYLVKEFDPMHRIDHAMMALEKFPQWELRKDTWGDNRVTYSCDIVNPDFEHFTKSMATAQEAICLAVLEAVKGKED